MLIRPTYRALIPLRRKALQQKDKESYLPKLTGTLIVTRSFSPTDRFTYRKQMSFNRHNIPTHKSSTEQQSPLAPAPRHLYFSSYRPPALALTMPKRPSSIALSPSSSPSPSSNMPKSKPWSGSDTLKKSKADHIPSWNLKGGRGGIDSLPEIPFYQVPSSTFAVIQETNPQAVAQRIVDAVAHMSSVGNYNNELVSYTHYTTTLH